MNTMFKIASIIAICFSIAHLCHADLLAGWEVNGVVVTNLPGGPPYTWSSTNGDTNHLQAWVSLGSGVNPSTTASQYGFKVDGGNEQVSLAGAIAAGHYIEITLEAEQGYAFDVESIEMHAQSSGSGSDNVAMLSSVEGYSDGAQIAELSGRQGITGGWDTDSSGWGGPISFSGNTNYQDLASVTFRIYGWNTSSGSGITYLRNLSGNDLEISGTIQSIPEPAVASFIALAGIGVFLVRRFV